jgi:UrcA family protein
MTTLTARIASVATLALAALPFAALTTAAHAATPSTGYAQESVRVGDLNLGSSADRATFDRRVGHAATQVCAREHNLGMKAACEAGVRTEAQEKAAANVQFASRN